MVSSALFIQVTCVALRLHFVEYIYIYICIYVNVCVFYLTFLILFCSIGAPKTSKFPFHKRIELMKFFLWFL